MVSPQADRAAPAGPACPLDRWLGPAAGRAVGSVLTPLYALGITLQNWRYDRGIGVRRVTIEGGEGGTALPVISVGNISAGGTGKTPTVVWLVRALLARGHQPLVALRGFRAAEPPPDFAASTDRARLIGRWSDEVDELLRALPETPIVAQPDRAAGIREFLRGREGRAGGSAPIDCVVLDDGFQHRRLGRMFDLVLVDATRSPFEDRLLPRGYLREPVSSIRRAHAVVLTRFDARQPGHTALLDRLRELTRERGPVFTATTVWGELQGLSQSADGQRKLTPASWLAGKRLVAACGIGNPAAFVRQLKGVAGVAAAPAGGESGGGSSRAGAGEGEHLITSLFYPDHHTYTPRNVREIALAAEQTGADAIVVTDKDWSKLRRLPRETWPCPVVRPLLTLEIAGGEQLVEAVAGKIRS